MSIILKGNFLLKTPSISFLKQRRIITLIIASVPAILNATVYPQ